jgi:hypothetical protein
MTTVRIILTNCLIWLLTLASPAAACGLAMADLQHGIGEQVSSSQYVAV